MTFKNWEPNLSWNALNLFTSVGSSRKIKSAICCQKLAPSNCWDFIFRGHLSGPAADPFGKDIISLYRSKSNTKNYPNFLDLKLQIWLAEGA